MKPSTFNIFDVKKYHEVTKNGNLTEALTLTLELPNNDILLEELPWQHFGTLNIDALVRKSDSKLSLMIELFIHQPIVYQKLHDKMRDECGSYQLMSLRRLKEEIVDTLDETWFENATFTTQHADLLIKLNEHENFTKKVRNLVEKYKVSCGINYLIAKKLQFFEFDQRMPRDDVYRLIREYNDNYYAPQFSKIVQSVHAYFPDILINFIEASMIDAIQQDEKFERYQSAWLILSQLDFSYKEKLLEYLRPEATLQNDQHYLLVTLGICDLDDELSLQEILINTPVTLWKWPDNLKNIFSSLNTVSQQLLILHTMTDYIISNDAFNIIPPQYLDAIRCGLLTKEESIEQWKKDITCELSPFLHKGPIQTIIGKPCEYEETVLFSS